MDRKRNPRPTLKGNKMPSLLWAQFQTVPQDQIGLRDRALALAPFFIDATKAFVDMVKDEVGQSLPIPKGLPPPFKLIVESFCLMLHLTDRVAYSTLGD